MSKKLSKIQIQRKAKPWNLWLLLHALLSYQTLSEIAPISLKLVFVNLPDRMSRWSIGLVCEIVKVSVFVFVFFILSIRNLDLQSGVCCIK